MLDRPVRRASRRRLWFPGWRQRRRKFWSDEVEHETAEVIQNNLDYTSYQTHTGNEGGGDLQRPDHQSKCRHDTKTAGRGKDPVLDRNTVFYHHK